MSVTGETLGSVAGTAAAAEGQRDAVRSQRRRGWLVRRALLTADLLGLCLAYAVSRSVLPVPGSSGLDELWKALVFVGTLPVWIVLAKLFGLYDRDEERTDHNTPDDFVGVFHLVTTGAWVIVITRWVTPLAGLELKRILVFWAAAFVLVMVNRAVARAICRRSASYVQRAVIAGAGSVGGRVARKLLRHPEYGIDLLGFVENGTPDGGASSGLPVLGRVRELPRLVDELDIDRVILAFPNEDHNEMCGLIRDLGQMDVQVDIVPQFHDVVGPSVDIHDVEGLAVVGLRPFRLSRSSKLLKRTMDLLVSGGALVCLAPVFAVIALMIKLDSRGPVLFRQIRMGCRDRTFRICKFRTMTTDAEERKAAVAYLNRHLSDDARMFKIVDDPRVTRVGRFLRRTSLDELPQLFNVLAGQMSLVGPRPLIPDEDRHVQDWGRRRLDLRPGMTGPWQVRGSSNIPFEEMVRLDYMYVTGWSLLLDFALMFRTVPAVFRKRHAY
jgi:exopolysaccharide biosynthesis polyprenyl glycosylphosphotransferase